MSIRENDQEREGCGGECRGVRLIGRMVFGQSLDLGHLLLPVSEGARADFPLDAAAKLSFRCVQNRNTLAGWKSRVPGAAQHEAPLRRIAVRRRTGPKVHPRVPAIGPGDFLFGFVLPKIRNWLCLNM